MSDALMTSTDREEALSRAYVAAVAAAAGYVTAVMDFDRDGVDLEIRAAGPMRPALDLQLKATMNLGEPITGKFRFPLKRRNYDLLREQTMIPRILVVLGLPRDHSDWLSVGPEELIMRRCARWVSLFGFPESENKESVTIPLPEENRFDVEALGALMNKARAGSIT
jgi:hypothetical protein